VLNAFRHHRNSHRQDVLRLSSFQPCSTPFGIIGIHTLILNAATRADYSSAQRLSASSEFTPEHDHASFTSCWCSTPFGIIGIHTGMTQPGETSFGRAQRLSASSEFTRFALAGGKHDAESAQRLSASSEFTLNIRTKHHPVTGVLNAFRHHRNSHRLVGADGRVRNAVLNAFRHHRNSHPCGVLHRLAEYRAQRLSASSEFTLRWFQPSCLPDVATPFSGISSFWLHFSFLNCPGVPFAWVNPPRIRHLTGSQASVQLTYRA